MTLKHQSMVYLAALVVAITLPASAQQMEELPIGAEGPMFDYEMTNIDGTLITLDDVKGEMEPCSSSPVTPVHLFTHGRIVTFKLSSWPQPTTSV